MKLPFLTRFVLRQKPEGGSHLLLARGGSHLNPNQQRGFALVVTLSLMILLTVIAVGLLSLAQISLRTSSASEQRSVARQNARMSLQLALGELQTALGPDSRASINSEMLASKPASPKTLGAVRAARKTPPSGGPDAYLETLRKDGLADIRWLVSSKQPFDPLTQSLQSANAETVEVQSYFNAAGAKDFILAGKVMIKASAGDGNSGALAWWIDDESQKAAINITAPDSLNGQPFKNEWKLTSAQQSPLHRVDSDPSPANYSPSAVTGYDSADVATIRKLLDPLQADIKYSVAAEKSWFQNNQMDFTTYSKGLPVDVTSGRLKQDLSYYLATGKGLDDEDPVIAGSPADPTYAGPALSGLDYAADDMPRMGRIKSWKDIGATVTGFDSGGTKSRPKTKSDSGIFPVIARAGIYFAPYFNNGPTPGVMGVKGKPYPGFSMDVHLAAYPRVTLWNPTTVPITDQWYIYQVGLTNHFMLYSNSAGKEDGDGAAIDNNNITWWTKFEAGSKMVFVNLMNNMSQKHSIKKAMPFMTFAIKVEGTLLPGQTRTFYPAQAGQLLKHYAEGEFEAIRRSNIGSANVMGNSPAPNNYFKYADANPGPNQGKEWFQKIWAKDPVEKYDGVPIPLSTQPARPERLDSYLYMRYAESGPFFESTWTEGCGYRLWKVNSSSSPELLQEFFSAEHFEEKVGGKKNGGTHGFPTYSIGNALLYDDPDDGVAATGFSQVTFGADPIENGGARRGHQIYLSYALEDPKSDFNSAYRDSSKQFATFLHYNPRSRYIFPGTYEEQKTGIGGGEFDPAIQGIRQELYSEGRPESAWINDWSADSYQFSEDGYGGSGDYGTASLFDLNLNANGLTYPIFDYPRADDGVLGLGDLQAVDFASYPWQPGNAFGNSHADPRVPRNAVSADISQSEDHFHIKDLNLGTNRYIDLSWLLNHSLWDRFFVSTIPYAEAGFTASPGKILRNSRHQIVPAAGKTKIDPATAFDQAAAQIEVTGAFNVNSTSVPAWKQFLGSNMNRSVDVRTGGGTSSPADQAAFPRILYPYRAEPEGEDRDIGSLAGTKAAFSSNRSLTDEELQRLAEKTVEEVKKRGPFLSIADFVNRRLVTADDTKYGEWAGLSGTLQTAIDRVTVEDKLINQHLVADSDLAFSSSQVPDYLEKDHVVGLPQGREQSRLAGAPGSLTQADILRSVGPMLTVRGDTFRIRAYGEARNKSTNAPEAKAWCEAVVQRESTPVDPADDVIAPDENTRSFGRQFKIISFRWLNDNEI